MRVRIPMLAAAAVGLAVAGLAGPAAAAQADVSSAGSLTLYGAEPGRVVLNLTYDSCARPVKRAVTGQIGSFRNQPAPGCQVVLTKPSVGSHTLCAGGGLVPQAFRNSPQVTVQVGRSVPCQLAER